jgi:hypothetical protein
MKVIITTDALNDREQIGDYIARDNRPDARAASSPDQFVIASGAKQSSLSPSAWIASLRSQ